MAGISKMIEDDLVRNDFAINCRLVSHRLILVWDFISKLGAIGLRAAQSRLLVYNVAVRIRERTRRPVFKGFYLRHIRRGRNRPQLMHIVASSYPSVLAPIITEL